MMDPALRNVMSTDLLFNIFSKFSFEQKIKAAQVCQTWKDVVYHKSMWRNITIYLSYDLEEHYVDTILPNLVKRNITDVSCSISQEPNREENRFNMNMLFKQMTSLKSIDIFLLVQSRNRLSELFLFDMPQLTAIKITGDQLWKTINNCVTLCQNLESLTLDNAINEFPYGDNLLRYIAKNLRKLRSLCLDISADSLTDIGIGYLTGCTASDTECSSNMHPQLETLEIQKCRITDQGLQYISSGFHSLKQFRTSSKHITNRGVGYLANMKCLKKLELYLHNCSNINEECLRLLSDAESNISCLKLFSNGSQFGDKALEIIGQSQLPLEVLWVADWNITDEGFRHLEKHGQNIIDLRLENCGSITDKSLEIIAEKFTALRCLDIGRCRNITGQGVRKLKKRKRNTNIVVMTYLRGY